MAKLRKRKTKSGHYSVDFRYNGHRYILSTKTKNKQVAKKILKDIEARIALGKFDIKDYQKSCDIVKDVIIKYIEEERPNKSPRTIKNENQYLTEFQKCLANRPISSISHQDVVAWRNDRLTKVKRITVNNEYRVIHHFFNWCIKHEYVKVNPLSKLRKLTIQESHRLYMNSDEFKAVMTKIDTARLSARGIRDKRFMEHFELFILFLLLTGLRLGEALKLQWSNINFEQGVAYVYQPKVNKSRVVPLHPIVIGILQKVGPDLFRKLNGEHVSRKFRQFLLLAELEGFKLHSLRHTFASNLVQKGSSLLAVKDLLGHSDVRTTMIYAKSNIASLQTEVNKIKIELPVGDILVTKKGSEEEKG
jgi:integrase